MLMLVSPRTMERRRAMFLLRYASGEAARLSIGREGFDLPTERQVSLKTGCSSAGRERLPRTQEAVGSNPTTLTILLRANALCSKRPQLSRSSVDQSAAFRSRRPRVQIAPGHPVLKAIHPKSAAGNVNNFPGSCAKRERVRFMDTVGWSTNKTHQPELQNVHEVEVDHCTWYHRSADCVRCGARQRACQRDDQRGGGIRSERLQARRNAELSAWRFQRRTECFVPWFQRRTECFVPRL